MLYVKVLRELYQLKVRVLDILSPFTTLGLLVQQFY